MEQVHSDRLHLGCGLTSPPGWLNVDGSWQVELANRPRLRNLLVKTRILPQHRADIPWGKGIRRLDLRDPLPFPDGSFGAIYTSHALEHLYQAQAVELLGECVRVLRPGGVLRVVVPDLHACVERYLAAKGRGDSAAADRLMEQLCFYDRSAGAGVMGLYYRLTSFHQHKWMYDIESLLPALRKAGLAQVEACGILESRIAEISEVEDPTRIANGEGIVGEGIKPS